MKIIHESRGRRRGSALVVSLIAVGLLAGISSAILVVSIGEKSERGSSIDTWKALELANSGVAHALVNVTAGITADIGDVEAPLGFAGGSYYASLIDNGDGSFTVTSVGTAGGSVQAVEAVLLGTGSSVFDNAIFAGNSPPDPTYRLELGGNDEQADDINGDIYSGQDVDVQGDADVDGTIRAQGQIYGATGDTGVTQPPLDLDQMNYESTADFDVAAMFAGSTYAYDSAGGYAYQMAENSPAHIFRLNPSDRASDTSATVKNDYFLEDPYEPVKLDPEMNGTNAYEVSLTGGGNPGADGNDKVYYIDGNLWVHNKKTFSFIFQDGTWDGIKVTFVVKGNIYFSDNIFYNDPENDGAVFIAMIDEDVADSGNIYFGDPVFGTLEQMESFMYAENDFFDNNLSASGSATVTVEGIMTAGHQVNINRDYGEQHSKLTVNFDDRISTGELEMPGVPLTALQGAVDYVVASWRRVAVP